MTMQPTKAVLRGIHLTAVTLRDHTAGAEPSRWSSRAPALRRGLYGRPNREAPGQARGGISVPTRDTGQVGTFATRPHTVPSKDNTR